MTRLAIDLDGVIVDFMGQVIEQHNLDFASELTIADITMWDFLPLTVFGIPTMAKHGGWEAFWRWMEEKEIYLWASEYEGATDVVRRLMADINHVVHLVTHRPEWSKGQTTKWLIEHRILPTVVYTNGKSKAELNYDLWIDDQPATLEALALRGAAAIRMVRPWNRPIEGIMDAWYWGDVERLVAEQAKGGWA